MTQGSRSPLEIDLDEEGPDSDRSSAIEIERIAADESRARTLSRRGRHRQWDGAAGIVTSSACGGLGMVIVDRIFRPDWDFAWSDHWLGAPLLFVCAAVVLGGGWVLLSRIERSISRAWPGGAAQRDAVRAVLHASLAGVLVWGTATWTFSGKMISTTALGTVGPGLFALAFMLVVGAVSWLGRRSDRLAARRRRFAPALAWAFGCLALSGAAFWADMTLYVGLYDRLHTLLEVVAFALLVGAIQGIGFVLVRRFPLLLVPMRASALALAALALAFVGFRPLRSYTDGLLAHAWVDEVYVGRTLKRAQMVELRLDGGESLEMARVHHIVERFGLARTRLDERWLVPAAPPSEATQALRGGRKNVVFFYVDTLRDDVANDATIMPHLAAFRAESLSFSNVYSTGSDTLRSLPTLTGGNYFAQHTHDADLVRLAEKGEHESTLIGPKSALEFLERHRPSFHFEKEIRVADYADGREDVWGYGADRPTAASIVDESIRFLEDRTSEAPFFLWLFHFDQHAWRELDEAWVTARREEYGFAIEGALDVRYRVVARSIDEEFGRFLKTLERTGHDDDTVIVFVSDHGEGLGRGGFWVHSVFLWEDLIRVPLVIRAPGVEPRVVDDLVSLVDVAPTIAPYLDELEEAPLYHGVDLLEFAVGRTPERELPIVLRGANRDRLERIGLIEPKTGRKLVLRLEAALPELFSTSGDRGDERNLARKEAARLREMTVALARSPVFPRSVEDFDLLLDRGSISASGEREEDPSRQSPPGVASSSPEASERALTATSGPAR